MRTRWSTDPQRGTAEAPRRPETRGRSRRLPRLVEVHGSDSARARLLLWGGGRAHTGRPALWHEPSCCAAPAGSASGIMTAGDTDHEDRGPDLAVRVVRVVLVVGPAILIAAVVIVLALSGGIRVRTPLSGLEESVGRFETPEGFRVERTEKSGDRECFLQCQDWTVRRYFATDEPPRPDELCGLLLGPTAEWLDQSPQPGRGPNLTAQCSLGARGLPENDRWCGRVYVYTSSGRARRLAVLPLTE